MKLFGVTWAWIKSRRNRAKLKWWYKVCRLPDNRYPKQLLSQDWETNPRKCRHRKTWSRTIDNIFHSLSLDKGEIVLDDMHEGNSSLKKYLHGRSDDGGRLLFKFRSGTHGLNEELGRHSDRDGRVECTLCGAECESVVHVLW